MAIELFFSNLLETLAEKLSDVFRLGQKRRARIFDPPLVVVPNANLKKWIQLRLAKANGIAMNIDFQYLETGLWRLLEILDENPEKPDMLDLSLRRIAVLRVLESLDPGREEVAPFLAYMKGPIGSGEGFPDFEKRMWQLSDRFASYFQDYEFHREEMIRRWLVPDFKAEDQMEASQREVYLSARNILSSVSRERGARCLSLMDYADEVLSALSRKNVVPNESRRHVHVFGFSSISTFHLRLIKELGRFFDIVVYSINPCREFWEDVQTPWEEKWSRRKGMEKLRIGEDEESGGELFGETPNRLLSLWGKPGRESIRMLCSLAGYDFNDKYVLHGDDSTVLKKIQNRVLTYRETGESEDRVPQDASLQIYGCPSRFREVETVYNSILYNLSNDDGLQLTDIAVQVPDISAYKPYIDAVFNREPRAVAYNLADARAEIESLYGKGVLGTLELASGRFSRPEVFSLLLNPCLMHKWGLSQDNVRVFAEWADALNIFHTFDEKDKQAKGYRPTDRFTWKQGLTRIRLGRVLSDPAEAIAGSGAGEPETALALNFGDKIPYSDAASSEPELVETFCAVIEKLHEITRLLNRGPRPAAQWKRDFLYACNELFEVPAELKSEASVQKSLFEALDSLLLYDRLREGESPGVDLALFKEFVASGLGDIWGGYGDYLTSGVTVSALLPMRPIPFSIVYVLGMEEGAFPGRPETSSLDLRLKRRRLGDVSLPERNCYLFLELLLSVREKFCVSYVARDLQKDRDLQPCSVLNQLKRYVETDILPEGAAFQVAQIPLKGSSEKYVSGNSTAGWSDAMVNYCPADRLIYYRESGLWPHVEQSMAEDVRKKAAKFVPDLKKDLAEEGAGAGAFPLEKIAASQLGKFLEDPVRQSIRRHLLLYDEDADVEEMAAAEDEPFYGRFPATYRLGMDPLRMWVDSIVAGRPETQWVDLLADICRKYYQRSRMESLVPEGVYGDLDCEEILEEVVSRGEMLKPLLESMAGGKQLLHALCTGETQDNVFVRPEKTRLFKAPPWHGEIHSPTPDGQQATRPVQVHGWMPCLWKDSGGTWNSLILTGRGRPPKKNRKPVIDKYILAPALSRMLALGRQDVEIPLAAAPVVFHVAYKTEVQSWKLELDPAKADEYVRALIEDYLDPNLRAWLPLGSVIDAADDVDRLFSEDISREEEARFRADLREALNESDDSLIHLAKPEVPADALRLARRRFGILFETLSATDTPE